jgi:hypothetical protein
MITVILFHYYNRFGGVTLGYELATGKDINTKILSKGGLAWQANQI